MAHSSRPRSQDPRRGRQSWELRAAVTETTYGDLKRAALALGRTCSWHAGLYIEGMMQATRELTEAERMQIDELLREPTLLRELLRGALRQKASTQPTNTAGR